MQVFTARNWDAANCRMLNQLLSWNVLEYYLAYKAEIFELKEKYEWSSVLDFGYNYRKEGRKCFI